MKPEITRYLRKWSWVYLILLFIFIIGFAAGHGIANHDLSLKGNDNSSWDLQVYEDSLSPLWDCFFPGLFRILQACLVLTLFSSHFLFFPFIPSCVMVRGYQAGYTCCMLIQSFGAQGFFLSILSLVLGLITYDFFIFGLSTHALERCAMHFRFRSLPRMSAQRQEIKLDYMKIMLLLAILSILGCAISSAAWPQMWGMIS